MRAAVWLRNFTAGSDVSAVDTFRDALFGNPPSPTFKPSREGALAAFSQLFDAATVAQYATAAGITTVSTIADRDAFYANTGNRTKLVYVNNNNGSATDPANGVYEYVGTSARLAQSFYAGIASIVQPLVDQANAGAALSGRYANASTDADIPGAAPGERGSKFWSLQAAALFTRFTGIFPVFGSRSGVAWAVTDSARRKLLWVERSTAIFRVHLPTIFTRAVTLSGGASIAGRLGIGQATIGAQPVDYPSYPGTRSGWLRAFTDSNRRVLFGVRRDMTVWAGGKRLLTTGDLGAVLPLSAKPEDGVATAYGDSLTAGSGETPYPLQLAGLIGGGFVATNRGMGSQKSTQIAMRAGAQPTYLTVQNNVIPAGANAVTVTAINGVAPAGFATANTPDYRLLSRADTNGTQSLTGYLAGIHGALTRTASGGPPSTVETYTFTPDAGTSGAACPASTLFIPDDKDAVFRRELWVEIGRNNATDTQRIRDDVSAMVRHYRPTLRRILVFGVINSATETRGTATWQSIVDLNNFLRTDHPSFFVTDAKGRDLRERLVASYDPAQAQDVTDFGNDVIATSLRRSGDPLHLNTNGYAVQAQLGLEFRTARFA